MSLKRKSIILGLAILACVSLAWGTTALAEPAGKRMFQGAGTKGLRPGGPQAGLEDVAGVLGMTAEDLRAAKAQGKTVAEIAAEKGISRDVLVEKIVALRKARIEAMVEEGQISRQQADVLLREMQTRIEAMIDASCKGCRVNAQGFRGPHAGSGSPDAARAGQAQAGRDRTFRGLGPR